MILGGVAFLLNRRPTLALTSEDDMAEALPVVTDTVDSVNATPEPVAGDTAVSVAQVTSEVERPVARIAPTRFADAEPRTMISDHPFRREALKVLNGHLEESDSVSRHKILSYCEHLRSAYTTRDIDFIRQVFSDNALIIVGHVVRQGEDSASGMNYSDKVRYSIRSKQAYIERLAKIFDSGKNIDVRFSDFRIMRHPTVKGIYGVTLRQKYTCGSYSDDGYLFLLWDFRDMSMPLIHVRTWQPSISLEHGGDDVIDISDFNLE
ncbi:MAG: hypothetical protein K2G27_02570 [Duncaniella sp.]|nr:hypothetical protein [Duncaniella sp.]